MENGMCFEKQFVDMPKNKVICDNAIIAYSKINSPIYDNIVCSVSGGADSDVVIDICYRCDIDKKIQYVWFDTGIEYQATKDHLKYLEDRYGIEIKKYRPSKPVPLACSEHGQPFLSKQCSEFISRLQRHNFDFENGNKDFDFLNSLYPGCKSALEWWCNKKQSIAFRISYNSWLKEFMIKNPPDFRISASCCNYAKKDIVHKIIQENKYDLDITGIRRAEGGVRQMKYKSCFDSIDGGCDRYRPLFWYTNKDRHDYESAFDIKHSKCYTEYGLQRTGCAGCPFAKDYDIEVDIIKKYEPKLYKAINNIFGKSYEYTNKYKSYVEEMNSIYGSYSNYLKQI